jgi:AcrR family transcriptional regulator
MPRWDADAEGRLLKAAMELFVDRGYDQVTVAEIAERAGLKKRSFFRYFADKREVLFGGAAAFEQTVVTGVLQAPEAIQPLDAVVTSLAAAGAELTSWGEPVRLRQQVIASSPELRERELIKLASLTAQVADALTRRGVEELTASLTAQAGMAAFTTAFELWAKSADAPNFHELIHDSLTRLRAAIGRRDE